MPIELPLCGIDPGNIDTILTYASGQDFGDDVQVEPLVLELLRDGPSQDEVVLPFDTGNCRALYSVSWVNREHIIFTLRLRQKRGDSGPRPCLGHLVTLKFIAGTGSIRPVVSRSGRTITWSRAVPTRQLELGEELTFCAGMSLDPCSHPVAQAA